MRSAGWPFLSPARERASSSPGSVKRPGSSAPRAGLERLSVGLLESAPARSKLATAQEPILVAVQPLELGLRSRELGPAQQTVAVLVHGREAFQKLRTGSRGLFLGGGLGCGL